MVARGSTTARTPGRGRTVSNLLAVTVLLPLALLALGLWEASRGAADNQGLVARRDRLAQVVARLEARAATHPDLMQLQFARDGRIYAGQMAVTEARGALAELDTAATLSRARLWLPPLVWFCGGAVAVLSGLALVGTALVVRSGRASRDRLVSGFDLVRRMLPPVMGAQVLLLASGFVPCVVFEALAIPEASDYSSNAIELLVFAVAAAGLILWTASRAVLALRRTAAAFTPTPLPLLGRILLPEDGPGLWGMADALAGRLGAMRPDTIVVGLTEGFFVSSGPKLLQPGGIALAGRTLYVPLPHLALLQPGEVEAVIGHELGHFSGADTEWSLRFMPIYAGVARSLEAVAGAGAGGFPVAGPALRLGRFAMDGFHGTVRHWSRLREFAADQLGAGVTSADASARALLRSPAITPRIGEVLATATEAPEAARDDLVAAILDHVRAQGLDPAAYLDAEQPHPTDTHPPTIQRLLALDRPPTPATLAEAAALPGADALAGLAAYVADPAGLCRQATADFLDIVRADRRAYRAALASVAAAVEGEDRALHENTRVAVVLAVGAVLSGLLGSALLAFGLPDLPVGDQQILAGAVLVFVPVLALWAAMAWRRCRGAFLLLRPDAMCITALDRPIAWDDIADLDMMLSRGTLSTRILLPPGAPFPGRRPGARGVRLDPQQRIVTLRARLPPGMTGQGFAALIGRYRQAAAARALLAAQAEQTTQP